MCTMQQHDHPASHSGLGMLRQPRVPVVEGALPTNPSCKGPSCANPHLLPILTSMWQGVVNEHFYSTLDSLRQTSTVRNLLPICSAFPLCLPSLPAFPTLPANSVAGEGLGAHL